MQKKLAGFEKTVRAVLRVLEKWDMGRQKGEYCESNGDGCQTSDSAPCRQSAAPTFQKQCGFQPVYSQRGQEENGDIEPLLNSESLYKCLSCFACVERCPRGVQPAKLVEAVRLAAVRKQGNNRMTANDVPELLDEDLPQQLLVSAFRKYSK